MFTESTQTGTAHKSDFRTLLSYEHYPFEVDGVINRVYIKKEDEEYGVVKETGREVTIKTLPKTREVKHDSKVYTKFFREEAVKLKDLSVPASNMLYLIIGKLEINSLQICLSEEDFLKHCGYKPGSKRLYYKAIVELEGLNIIKRKGGFLRCYWVNANVIYNGDRTKLV